MFLRDSLQEGTLASRLSMFLFAGVVVGVTVVKAFLAF
jgi:hypothetical protein